MRWKTPRARPWPGVRVLRSPSARLNRLTRAVHIAHGAPEVWRGSQNLTMWRGFPTEVDRRWAVVSVGALAPFTHVRAKADRSQSTPHHRRLGRRWAASPSSFGLNEGVSIAPTEEAPTLLAAQAVVTPNDEFSPGWVRINEGEIGEVGSGLASVADPPDPRPGYLIPGFVDQHCHGGGGAGFEGDQADIAVASAAQLRGGTTSLVGSMVSADPRHLLTQAAELAAACDAGILVGIHLEGPWLSPPRRGAHDERNLRNPTIMELQAVLAAGRGNIKMITLAPELPGALEAITECVRAGVVAAIGHTDADYAQTQAAIAAGATVATHLFNAMPPMLHRAPGPVAALMNDPSVYLELIVDGVHVQPGAIQIARQAATDRVVLVTDAMAAAAAHDGHYRLGSLDVDVVDGVARVSDSGAIAGSTLTMAAAVRNYVEIGGATVAQAARSAATVPAQLIQLSDRGSLAPGLRADICHLGPDLELRGVWQAGIPIPVV